MWSAYTPILCRHISQFTVQHLMAANMQQLAALRADLLRLWQFMHDLLQFGLRYVLRTYIHNMCSAHKEPFGNLVGNRMMP